jgi:hypothetical protein
MALTDAERRAIVAQTTFWEDGYPWGKVGTGW